MSPLFRSTTAMLICKYDKSLVLVPFRRSTLSLKLKGISLNAGKSLLRVKLFYGRYKTFLRIVGFSLLGVQLLIPDMASSQACFLLCPPLGSLKLMTIGLYSPIVERTRLGPHFPSRPAQNISLLLSPRGAVCTS
jgi:hypothetical protein